MYTSPGSFLPLSFLFYTSFHEMLLRIPSHARVSEVLEPDTLLRAVLCETFHVLVLFSPRLHTILFDTFFETYIFYYTPKLYYKI